MKILILLIKRYLYSNNDPKLRSLLRISFVCIAASATILALVFSIIKGFEHVTHQKLKGIHADILVAVQFDQTDLDKARKVLNYRFPLLSWTPRSSTFVMLYNPTNKIQSTAQLNGIHPVREVKISNLKKYVSDLSLESLTSGIIIGKKCAENLHVKRGDKLILLYPDYQSYKRHSIKLHEYECTIVGTFCSGIQEFDTSVLFCSLDYFAELFPDIGIQELAFSVPDSCSIEQVKKDLQRYFKVPVMSWKDLYPSLIAALTLEKYAMTLLLSFIMFIALLNTVALLFLLIRQKQVDIALLRALGLSSSRITLLFFIMGLIITAVATAVGLLVAWGAGTVLQQYPLITLPDSYIVQTIPIQLDIFTFITIFFLSLTLSAMIVWYASRKATESLITDVLRTEG